MGLISSLDKFRTGLSGRLVTALKTYDIWPCTGSNSRLAIRTAQGHHFWRHAAQHSCNRRPPVPDIHQQLHLIALCKKYAEAGQRNM
jgi:hypothetical protein